MSDIKRCQSCIYWRGSNGYQGTSLHFCHHLLLTNKRRVEVDGICESYQRKGVRRIAKKEPSAAST